MSSSMPKCYVLPGVPHILLAHDRNPGWKKVRESMEKVREEIESLRPDLLLLYSTYWPSILGHQIQADPNPKWIHVDEEFHDLGSIPYEFTGDPDFAEEYRHQCTEMGLLARTVSYRGFPIDTGSVVALSILTRSQRIPTVIVSSNIYADRAETVVLGKAALKAVKASGKRVIPIAITSLSNRLHQKWIDPMDDHVSSLKDQEWNQKLLEFLSEGRLEDVSQLSRQFHREARVSKVANFKPFWWLSSVMGATNLYEGEILAYEAVYGSGAAVVGLTPSPRGARDLEFDEDSPDFYQGERNVLGSTHEPARGMGPLPGEDEDEPQV